MTATAGPFDGLEQNGSSGVSLPQFNLWPSGHHEADKDVDMEAEELDTVDDMPPMSSFSPVAPRMGTMGRSSARMSRLNSTTRAASSLHRSFTSLSDSPQHEEFQAEVGTETNASYCQYLCIAGIRVGRRTSVMAPLACRLLAKLHRLCLIRYAAVLSRSHARRKPHTVVQWSAQAGRPYCLLRHGSSASRPRNLS